MRRDLSLVDNGWDYARLTKTANECGGVTELVDSIYDDGFADGVKQTCIIGGATVVVVASCCYVFKKYRDKKKLENKKKYIDKLSSELKSQQIELDN